MYRRAAAAVVAMGTAMTVSHLAKAQVNVADQTPPPALAQAPAQQRAFNIPAQPLSSALNAFGSQSGLQVSIDAAVARGLQSQPVNGTMTAEAALRQMLAGSGIVIRFTQAGGVILSKPDAGGAMQLDPVQVQGFAVPSQAMIDNIPPPYAGGQVATGGQLGLLGNRGVMDTPFNQSNYTAKKAQDQQARTVRDVLIDDPSVRTWGQDGSPNGDNMWIRGFNVLTQNAAYGGLYGMLPTFTIMPEMAERIEVLKGPSAMLTGMAPNNNSIGGIVNIVPKRAPTDDLTQISANYTSSSQFAGAADIARRFGAEKQFGVRLNGVFKAGQTAVENNSDQRGLGVLGLDFRGDHVRVSADIGYQYQYIGGIVASLGVDDGVPIPWAPRSRMNPGQPWGYRDSKDLFAVVRAEVDMTDNITAYASFGAHDFRSSGLY
jgi:iron complex outermembrane receptor protein